METIGHPDWNEVPDVLPKVDVEYSCELEIKRVEETLTNLDWFKEHGYAPDLGWPTGFDPGRMPVDNVADFVIAGYAESSYKSVEEKVRSLVHTYGDRFFSGLRALGVPLVNSYVVQFSRYGTAGSYWPPNTIVINIVRRPDLIRTIFHEMVHLAVEDLIMEYGFDQLTKERIVDTILKRIMGDVSDIFVRMQADPPYSDRIAELFDSHYPDIRMVCLNLAQIHRESRDGK